MLGHTITASHSLAAEQELWCKPSSVKKDLQIDTSEWQQKCCKLFNNFNFSYFNMRLFFKNTVEQVERLMSEITKISSMQLKWELDDTLGTWKVGGSTKSTPKNTQKVSAQKRIKAQFYQGTVEKGTWVRITSGRQNPVQQKTHESQWIEKGKHYFFILSHIRNRTEKKLKIRHISFKT